MQEIKRRDYLKAMGIAVWQVRAIRPSIHTKIIPDATVENLVENNQMAEQSSIINHDKPITDLSWDELIAQVNNCQRCELYKTRTHPVFGVGNRQASLLIIGEAPGASEDQQGEPFVGRAGQLLNAMLQTIGLQRETIYIANILKSRPPDNRDPKTEEVMACTPYLLRQVTLLKPKLILAVGRISAQFLINTKEAMGKLRGREFNYGPDQVPLLVTYHPAYLLRAPREKAKAWEDLQQVALRLKQLQTQ